MKTKTKNKRSLLVPTLILILTSACASTNKKEDEDASDAPIKSNRETPPKTTRAIVKTIWVPDKVEETKWEEGHFLHIIEKPSTWKVE